MLEWLKSNDRSAEKLRALIENLHAQRFEVEKESKILNAFMNEGVVYMTDMDTNELLFVNEEAEKYFGENAVGKKCYSVLQNRNAVCPFCTNDIIKSQEGKVYSWVFKNEVIKRIYLVRDLYLRLTNGRERHIRVEQAIDLTEHISKILEYADNGKD